MTSKVPVLLSLHMYYFHAFETDDSELQLTTWSCLCLIAHGCTELLND